MEKITSKILLKALRNKYPNAAVLSEVTMEDEEELAKVATAEVILRPQLRKYYESKGINCDVELPEDFMLNKSVYNRRIDALIFEWKQRTAVEIKISRSDFFRDTAEKRAPWQKHTHRFVYLVPKGLVKPEEVPQGCGLWEYENGYIKIVKKAVSNKQVTDFPMSMTKYFAWRAFAAENKLAKLTEKK